MALDLIPDPLRQKYEVHEWRHACAILAADLPEEWSDLLALLDDFRLCQSWISSGGGDKSRVADAIDRFLGGAAGARRSSTRRSRWTGCGRTAPPTRSIASRTAWRWKPWWNNKDPFFDRDLNNFRLLFDLRAVSVGVIITRCDPPANLFNRLGRGSGYGMSTTHMSKLAAAHRGRERRGLPPILVIGISERVYAEDG